MARGNRVGSFRRFLLPPDLTRRRLFLMLWLAALAPRLTLGIIFANYPITLSDMLQYDMLARSLAQGNGYRWYTQADLQRFAPYLSLILDLSQVDVPDTGLVTTFRAPGYPAALAAIYGLAPDHERIPAARLVQASLGALLAPLTALLALRFGTSRRAAALAGLGMAFYPILLFYPIALVSENLYIPLISVSLLALLRAAGCRRPAAVMACGALLGVTILTRSVLAPFAVLAAVWMGRFGALGKKGAALLIVTALVVCVPWAVRNTLVAGRPTFVETSLGYNLYVGYHPEGNGGFDTAIGTYPLTILDDAERDRFTRQAALGFIGMDPADALRRVVRRAAFFTGVEDRELTFFYSANFFGEIRQPWLGILYALLITPWLAVAVLAIPGAMILPERRTAWLMAAVVAGYALPHLLIMAEPRFHLALVPLLLPLAAHAAVEHRRGRALVLTSTGGRLGWAARAGIGAVIGLMIWAFVMRWEQILATLGPGGNLLFRSY